MNENNKLNEMIAVSLEKIKELVDAQTIIGEPISTPGGTTVIPVSKITVGYASGGVDYNSKNAPAKPDALKNANFGGGGGTGISVTPVAFLTINADGHIDLLTLANPSGDSVDKLASLLERTPDIIEKIKVIFKGKKKPENEVTKDTADEDIPF